MTIFNDGKVIGTRRVDLFVEEVIMVETKAIIELNDSNIAQTRNYLEGYDLPVGLLINFGSRSMQYKRIYNTKHPDSKPKSERIYISKNLDAKPQS